MKIEYITTKFIGKKFIKIDGKYYSPVSGRNTKEGKSLSFEQVDIKEYESTIDDLAEKVSKKTNVKKLIKQGLYELTLGEIKIIKKEMAKDKPLVRNNDGCFFLTIGKARLQLRS